MLNCQRVLEVLPFIKFHHCHVVPWDDADLRLKMTLSTVLYTAAIVGVIILYSIESQRMPHLDAD